MGTHGAASTRTRALPPGNRPVEATHVNSAVRRPMLNLSDWPVSRSLFTVIVAALLMGLIFGGLRVSDAESSASQLGRVSQLATLGQRLTVLVNALQAERDATLTNLVASNAAPLQPLYANTVSAVQAVRQSTAGIGGGFPANIQADVTVVNADI